MEYKSQNIVCQNCKGSFTIEVNDFGFYEKIGVPPPTFCPDCRRQRRWAWRNNMSLYNRQCDLCGKSVISIYSKDSRLTIYCNKCWWSDKWDPKSYGVEYDFSKPFFTQFRELIQKVPHMAIINDDNIASLNCEYTHDWWFSKNCYMCLSGWYVENVLYSFFIVSGGKDIMDCMAIRSKNEWLYECFICRNCYRVKYSSYLINCIDSQFLLHCRNCSDCFMCINLIGKKYCFKNKEYLKEEYETILKEYKLDTLDGVEKARKEFEEFILKFPRKAPEILQSLNCTGENIANSKNTKNSFIVKNMENCSYTDYSGDTNNPDKDCYDVTLTGGASECYENVVGDHSQRNLFGLYSVKSMDITYTQHCPSSKHLFGCVGLRKGKYSILNKEYTKEDYGKLVKKIIEQMKIVPYVDKLGNKYEFGEFYPIELSPFGYNETNAPEVAPLSENEARQKGYNWQNDIQRTIGKKTLKPEQIPTTIRDIDDLILNEVLICENCQRNYKIVPNELIFYRKMDIPIPRKCFFCRHNTRLARRNPFKLWHRNCMCDKKNHFHGAGECKVEFETSYAPDRLEIVYCEKCYQAEVY